MTPSPTHDPYAAFRIRDYRMFVIGFFVSVIAGQMQTVTALYEIYQKNHSTLSLGWVGLALAVPMLLLALPAGHLADRYSRRRIHIVTQVVCAACAMGLAWLSHFWSDWQYSVPAMYGLLGLGNAGATLGRPSRASLMPTLVPAEVFPNAVTWNSSIFESASVIGPAVGGLICARNIPLAYVFSATFFIGCAIFTFFLPDHRPAPQGTAPSALSDLAAGVRFVWSNKIMLGAMTLDLFAVLLGGAVFLLPAFAEDILHVGATGYGWLRAAPSIGAIAMAMTLAHIPLRRAGPMLLLSVAGFGIATIVFGLSKSYSLSFAMLVLTGAFDNISVVVRHTTIQMLTPDHMRGRVNAVNQIFIGSSNELGGLESGLTAHWFGPVISVVGGGIGTLIVVANCFIGFPEIRRINSLKDLKSEDPEVHVRGFSVVK